MRGLVAASVLCLVAAQGAVADSQPVLKWIESLSSAIEDWNVGSFFGTDRCGFAHPTQESFEEEVKQRSAPPPFVQLLIQTAIVPQIHQMASDIQHKVMDCDLHTTQDRLTTWAKSQMDRALTVLERATDNLPMSPGELDEQLAALLRDMATHTRADGGEPVASGSVGADGSWLSAAPPDPVAAVRSVVQAAADAWLDPAGALATAAATAAGGGRVAASGLRLLLDTVDRAAIAGIFAIDQAAAGSKRTAAVMLQVAQAWSDPAALELPPAARTVRRVAELADRLTWFVAEEVAAVPGGDATVLVRALQRLAEAAERKLDTLAQEVDVCTSDVATAPTFIAAVPVMMGEVLRAVGDAHVQTWCCRPKLYRALGYGASVLHFEAQSEEEMEEFFGDFTRRYPKALGVQTDWVVPSGRRLFAVGLRLLHSAHAIFPALLSRGPGRTVAADGAAAFASKTMRALLVADWQLGPALQRQLERVRALIAAQSVVDERSGLELMQPSGAQVAVAILRAEDERFGERTPLPSPPDMDDAAFALNTLTEQVSYSLAHVRDQLRFLFDAVADPAPAAANATAAVAADGSATPDVTTPAATPASAPGAANSTTPEEVVEAMADAAAARAAASRLPFWQPADQLQRLHTSAGAAALLWRSYGDWQTAQRPMCRDFEHDLLVAMGYSPQLAELMVEASMKQPAGGLGDDDHDEEAAEEGGEAVDEFTVNADGSVEAGASQGPAPAFNLTTELGPPPDEATAQANADAAIARLKESQCVHGRASMGVSTGVGSLVSALQAHLAATWVRTVAAVHEFPVRVVPEEVVGDELLELTGELAAPTEAEAMARGEARGRRPGEPSEDDPEAFAAFHAEAAKRHRKREWDLEAYARGAAASLADKARNMTFDKFVAALLPLGKGERTLQYVAHTMQAAADKDGFAAHTVVAACPALAEEAAVRRYHLAKEAGEPPSKFPLSRWARRMEAIGRQRVSAPARPGLEVPGSPPLPLVAAADAALPIGLDVIFEQAADLGFMTSVGRWMARVAADADDKLPLMEAEFYEKLASVDAVPTLNPDIQSAFRSPLSVMESLQELGLGPDLASLLWASLGEVNWTEALEQLI